MDVERVQQMLDVFPSISIVVFGDFFLDQYLVIEAELAERSLETGLTAHQVVAKRLSPGAAGTVVANLRALNVGQVACMGVIGRDGEGFVLKQALKTIGADHSHLIESDERFTPCYTKPMLREKGVERELERIDIKNRSPMPAEIEDNLIERLERLLPEVDAVIIADQVQERNCGVITDRVRVAIADLAARSERIFFADSRVRIGEFRNVITKPNKSEAVSAIRGADATAEGFTLEEAISCGRELGKLTAKPVFMTAQENGIFIFNDGETHVPAIRVDGEIDAVGAGDSCTAGIVSALCAGANLEEAALLGNIVASITVQQIGRTGTASPAQVLARAVALHGR